MEEKPGRKRESIDEILSDLNGLLNKMPSILDGIKMPELQPLEPPKSSPRPAPEPEPEVSMEENKPAEGPSSSGEGDKADKTVVIPAFSGLEEGSRAPVELPAEAPVQPQEPAAPGTSAPEPQKPSGFPEGSRPEPLPEQVEPSSDELPAGPEAEEAAPAGPAPEPAAETEPAAARPGETQAAGAPEEAAVQPEPAEGAAPEEAQPAPEISFGQAEKTVSLEAFSGLTEGAPEPLSDEGAAGEGGKAPPSDNGAALVPGEGAAGERQEEPSPVPAENAAQEASGAAEAEAPAALPTYENTKDFGIPDIDSLLQLSGGEPERSEEPAASLPEAGVIPESVQEMEESWGISSEGADSAGERPSEEGASMQPKGPEEEKEIQPPADTAPEESGQPGPAPEAQVPSSPFDSFALGGGEAPGTEPAPGDAAGERPPEEKPSPEGYSAASEQSAAPSLEFETPADAISAGGQARGELPTAAGENVPGGIELFPAAEQAPSPEPQEQPAPGAPGLELGASPAVPEQTVPGGAGIEAAQSTDQAGQTLPGGAGMELGAVPSSSGGETLVVPPSETPSGEEDKTAIFQSAPSVTSRAQAGDLSDLAAKAPPEGIPPERVRSLVFMYSPEDKALCATVLAELDSICLKSASKPMFIKRASVREFEPGMSAEPLQQSVTESGAQGLVCLGSIPQEKIYELDNVFASSGGFFRYYDSSMFSHSAALDLVTDLILR